MSNNIEHRPEPGEPGYPCLKLRCSGKCAGCMKPLEGEHRTARHYKRADSCCLCDSCIAFYETRDRVA